jgi:hypothetical protein
MCQMDSYTRLRSDSLIGSMPLSAAQEPWHFVFRGFKVAVFSVLSLGIG